MGEGRRVEGRGGEWRGGEKRGIDGGKKERRGGTLLTYVKK